MHAPLYSTISLVAELLVSMAIVIAIRDAYRENVFRKRLVALALSYEVLFNISYMVYRVLTHEPAKPESRLDVGLAIFHGTLSLVMFLALIAFMAVAWKRYAKGVNFFKQHRAMTGVFLALWALSVLSGIVFYFVEYSGA